MITREEIYEYHLGGKIALDLIKDLKNQKDLSLAYTPGVAKPCLSIAKDKALANSFTSKGNIVAVITDGSAVLGLGDIGPEASIPVMEGKCVLFKSFANVDAWPVPLDNVRKDNGKSDPQKIIDISAALAPMYGGINLEDIAAPACFEIEDKLDAMLDIPVFHDDQWGTAIITLAGLKNYLVITKKEIENISIVVNGAGAAGIRIADMISAAGGKNITLLDSKGIVHSGRTDLNDFKRKYSINTEKRSLSDAMQNADVFIGVSVEGCVSKDMVVSMANYPGIFAMANPNPEILPELVKECLGDNKYIMATGRSDYPNQVNNVLGFPFIFRGALNVGAKTISMEMKIAAADALASLAREDSIPKVVEEAYGHKFKFGDEYIIPTPFDPRIASFESNAVARAALKQNNSRFCKDIDLSDTLDLIIGEFEFKINGLVYFDNKLYIEVLEDGDTKKYIQTMDSLDIESLPGEFKTIENAVLNLLEVYKLVSLHFDNSALVKIEKQNNKLCLSSIKYIK